MLPSLPTLLLLTTTLLVTLSFSLATADSHCPPHNSSTTHILSTSPLIIYISSFLSACELSHLRTLSQHSSFSSSGIADAATGDQSVLASVRTSRSTSLSAEGDGVVEGIMNRALRFQGLSSPSRLEPLQLVSYTQNQKYHAHTDWFTSPSQATPAHGGNRLSSFFAYVDVSEDIVGGGTGFPFIFGPNGEEEEKEEGEWWCEYVSCDAGWGEGVVVRPIAGNAVFWRNLKEVRGRDGKVEWVGDQKTLHAGLPVQRGSKLGMNIWTRQGDFGDEFRSTSN